MFIARRGVFKALVCIYAGGLFKRLIAAYNGCIMVNITHTIKKYLEENNWVEKKK